MTSRTSPPFKILFDKLIRTHHSCKSKKTSVYSLLKSAMPEKPRFDVHLPIPKSNWNISSLTFSSNKGFGNATDYSLASSQNHMHFWTIWNSVIKFCRKRKRKGYPLFRGCCNCCQISERHQVMTKNCYAPHRDLFDDNEGAHSQVKLKAK